MKTKELIEYLQGFPEDSDVSIGVIDTNGERKLGFEKVDVIFITDEGHPMIVLDVDSKNPADLTDDEGEDNGQESDGSPAEG